MRKTLKPAMTIVPKTPDGSKNLDLAAQELFEHHDLQDAQIDSMRHVWDNPEDEAWNNPEIPGWEVDAPVQCRSVRNTNKATEPTTCGFAQQPAAPMDEYDHLTDSQWDLYDRMSAISEDCFCAGWIIGNEYDIWHALQQGDPSPLHRRMSPRLLRLCQALSVEAGGWIYWVDGPLFAPMKEWLTMVDERRKLAATQK